MTAFLVFTSNYFLYDDCTEIMDSQFEKSLQIFL